jgi:broad specificity phosphatase PhoE
VIFETHATSVDNEAGLAAGPYDCELSATGERQARQLGERYAGYRLDAIFCSDLRRSYRTAEIAFAGGKTPIHRDARLREVDYGEWTRRPAGEMEAAKLNHIIEPFPGGESYEQACGRIIALLREIAREYADGTVLIVGHRAVFYALEQVTSGAPLREIISAPWQWRPGWNYKL